MMSSILNSDFISVRLMVQGMSLENKRAEKNNNKEIHNTIIIRFYTCCLEDADSSARVKVNVGIGAYRELPLVEENQHRGTVQRLSREYRQQLDTGGGYLSNVGRVHHKL